MDNTQMGSVSMKHERGVSTIEFFHPAQNSFPGRLLAELATAIHQAGESGESAVVVLRSAGDRTFCAGASFDELSSIGDFEKGKQFFLGFAHVINAMRQCPKMVIGRVQGKAVGGGVGLAAATDLCMASKWASIKLSELAIGIGPFVVGPAVERKVGVAAFSQLAINATEWQTAAWAKEKGLFAEVFDTTEQLDQYLEHFTQKLVNSNPVAMRQLKQVCWLGTEHWGELLDERAAISGRLVLSDFTKNAIAAFQKK